jgi:DNA-binding NarL/FixJ family response regulator
VIRVLIADDQQLVRHGLRLILASEPDLDVVAEAGDGVEALAAIAATSPDVALMDIRMPRLDGVAATRQLMDAGSATKVLMLTTFGGEPFVYAALQAGASGFLLKTAPAQRLINAVRTVATGEALLDPSVTRQLVERYVSQPAPSDARPTALGPLTDREIDVLSQIARGLANVEIAKELHLSEATVKTYVGRILTKLGLRDRTQMVITAYETGLVRPGRKITSGTRRADGSSANIRTADRLDIDDSA